MRTTMCCRNIGPSYYIYASQHFYSVFDHIILLYNAEIRGTCNIHSLRLQKSNTLILNDCYKDLLCETLHFNFSKYILGVFTERIITWQDRFPLHFDMIKSMAGFMYGSWWRGPFSLEKPKAKHISTAIK